jgi:hypothetical protein
MSLREMASIAYWAEDVAAAAAWYKEFLGSGPRFTRPGPDGRAELRRVRHRREDPARDRRLRLRPARHGA